MSYKFTMPKAGEGIAEGEIVKWLVSVGDTITEDATIVEIQNDKLVSEIPSPVTGKIIEIVVDEGTVANVGDTLATIEVEGHVSETTEEEIEKETTQEEAPKEETIIEKKVEVQTEKEQAPLNTDAASNQRILAMPSVRQFARDQGIDISQIIGTGQHGHITKSDVENFDGKVTTTTEAKEATPTPKVKVAQHAVRDDYAVEDVAHTSRKSMSATRRAISDAMVTSKAHAAHVTIFDEVEVPKLMVHRKKFKEVAESQDIKLTYLAYMAKAVVTVLRKYPILNASVDETTNEVVYKNYYNIGIAVDTEHGLYVPVVKDADRKGMFSIAKEIAELAVKTNNRELTNEEMSNGSTSISNIGSAWGMWFTPIINFPEVSIFGMGRIEKKPVVLEDGTVGVSDVLYLSMSFDHRIIDGSVAQKAMNELKRLMADPELLMMEG